MRDMLRVRQPLPFFLRAEEQGKQNIAFVCHLMLGDLQKCIDQLVACGRVPEAAFFARTYCPSKMGEVRMP